MALILGLDGAQNTGWALYDTAANLSAIRAGVLKATPGKLDYEIKAASLGLSLMRLVKHDRPDFVVIERAPRQSYGGSSKRVKFMGEDTSDGDEGAGATGLQSILSTNQMTAGLCGVIGAYGIPIATIMPVTWRKSAYGFGTHKGWARKDWKQHARNLCAQHRITVTNDDMAEACWIAFAGSGLPAFKMMMARAA